TDGTHAVSATGVIKVANVAPTADAGNDATVTKGVALALKGAAADLSAEDGKGLKTTWDFGDRATASGTQVTHAWTNTGTYTVKFTVTDKDGASTTDTVKITVIAAQTGTPGNAAGAIWVSEGAAVFSVHSDGKKTSGNLTWVGK